MTDEQFNLTVQLFYDNLTTERFDILIKAVSNKLQNEPDDFVDSIYQSVSKTRKLSFKQFKCLSAYIKLIKANTEYKQF